MWSLRPKQKERPAAPSCWRCTHFVNDPGKIEAAMPGLVIMSSAYGSVRAEDGLCQRHDRYVRANFGCDQFRCAGNSS
jgi:hypothetical protein